MRGSEGRKSDGGDASQWQVRSNTQDQQPGTRTHRQENDGDDDDKDDHEPELSPAGLALVIVRRRQLFRRSRRVRPDRRDVGLDVVCGTKPATPTARSRGGQPVTLVLIEEAVRGTQPIMPPCSTTSAPRSRKISLSSWMPLSISRISVSRSLIWLSWNSSSCAGIWLLSGVAQAKGKGERCRLGCEGEERGRRANAPLDDLLLLQLLELVLLSRTDLPLLLEIEQSCRCSVRCGWRGQLTAKRKSKERTAAGLSTDTSTC